MNKTLIKHEPYIDDKGIWVPVNEYAHEALGTAYRCVMTKEMFVEAYNKWIKNSTYGNTSSDDADCWCE